MEHINKSNSKNFGKRDKFQLQEQLKELGIRFSADSSYDELKQMYQERMHLVWTLKASKGKVIRRRRKKSAQP